MTGHYESIERFDALIHKRFKMLIQRDIPLPFRSLSITDKKMLEEAYESTRADENLIKQKTGQWTQLAWKSMEDMKRKQQEPYNTATEVEPLQSAGSSMDHEKCIHQNLINEEMEDEFKARAWVNETVNRQMEEKIKLEEEALIDAAEKEASYNEMITKAKARDNNSTSGVQEARQVRLASDCMPVTVKEEDKQRKRQRRQQDPQPKVCGPQIMQKNKCHNAQVDD